MKIASLLNGALVATVLAAPSVHAQSQLVLAVPFNDKDASSCLVPASGGSDLG